jgi:serine/threonine-protein kinase
MPIEHGAAARAMLDPSVPSCPHCDAVVSVASGPCPRCGQELGTGEDPLLGEVIAGNFLILDLIGVGAMGRVYKAKQLSLDKEVAIKVLHGHLTHDPNVAKRFQREARAASRLSHPNSLQIIDFGQTEEGTLFIAMEVIQGRDLGKVLAEEFPFSLSRIADVVGQVCSALEDAHAAGIIHRDLKPENILVVQKGGHDFVKVCDFGIAKIQDPKGDDPDAAITMAGVVCGTPEYMSPEQARGEKLDARSDVYAVGVILYQLATGAVPFTADSALGVVTKHLTEQAVPPRQRRPDLGIHAGLETIILKALSKDKTGRHASVTEIKMELDTLVRLAGTAATVAPKGSLLAPSPTGTLLTGAADGGMALPTSRAPVFAAAVIGILALAGAGFWFATRGGRVAAADPPSTSVTVFTAALPASALPAATAAPVSAVPETAEAAPATASDAPAEEAPAEEPTTTRRHRERRSSSGSETSAPSTTAPAEESDNPAQAAFDAGRAAFRAGNYAEAISKYQEAQRHGMGGVEIAKALGRAYMRTGNMTQACAMYRRVLASRPSDLEASGIVSGQCGG